MFERSGDPGTLWAVWHVRQATLPSSSGSFAGIFMPAGGTTPVLWLCSCHTFFRESRIDPSWQPRQVSSRGGRDGRLVDQQGLTCAIEIRRPFQVAYRTIALAFGQAWKILAHRWNRQQKNREDEPADFHGLVVGVLSDTTATRLAESSTI